MSGRPKILFLCTGNSCRSQMAEGWARHLWSDRLEPYSAGTAPHGIDRKAISAMAEVGVDISGHRPKNVSDLSGVSFDLVVTVCDHAKETCPILPGAVRILHAGFADPPGLAAGAVSEEEALVHYRRVRDEIKEFVETLPEVLAAEG